MEFWIGQFIHMTRPIRPFYLRVTCRNDKTPSDSSGCSYIQNKTLGLHRASSATGARKGNHGSAYCEGCDPRVAICNSKVGKGVDSIELVPVKTWRVNRLYQFSSVFYHRVEGTEHKYVSIWQCYTTYSPEIVVFKESNLLCSMTSWVRETDYSREWRFFIVQRVRRVRRKFCQLVPDFCTWP